MSPIKNYYKEWKNIYIWECADCHQQGICFGNCFFHEFYKVLKLRNVDWRIKLNNILAIKGRVGCSLDIIIQLKKIEHREDCGQWWWKGIMYISSSYFLKKNQLSWILTVYDY